MPQPVQPAKKRRTWLIVVGVVGAVIVVCCGIGTIIAAVNGVDNGSAGGDSPSASTQAIQPSAEQKTESKATKQAPGLNTPVRDGKFEFVVSSVECGKPSIGEGFLARTAQGQYCLVSLSVKNIGNKPQMFIDANQKGFALSGAQYAPDSAATLAIGGEQSTWLNNINPGNSISGQIAFDLPAGAKLTKLELHDSILSGGVTVTVS
jgi:hypothetical protein